MRLRFEELDFQQRAVAAVIDSLEGQLSVGSQLFFQERDRLLDEEHGVPNPLLLEPDILLENIQRIQRQNGLDTSATLQTTKTLQSNLVPNLSIEMETGTGKTYVYLRTLFELQKNYGYKKFIILVPSIAIREGVLKSIRMTEGHFKTLYNPKLEYFAYDSGKRERLRHFATGVNMQIMILNIQSIIRDFDETDKRSNIMHRLNDKLGWRKPLDFVQSVKPVLVLDEPQSIDNTPSAKHAIAKLNPGLILRYSATHKDPYNMLYKLDPVTAYDKKLVKRIEVASIITQNLYNEAYIKLIDLKSVGGRLKAVVEIQQEQKSGFKNKQITIAQDDDLYLPSGKRELYKDYRVDTISNTSTKKYIKFSNGKELALGQAISSNLRDIQKQQIIECVTTHFEKALTVKDKGIKILSLFFIDKVANYRNYGTQGEGQTLGEFGQWFEDAYKDCQQKSEFRGLIPHAANTVHGGYFAKDRKGQRKDTKGETKDDALVYALIMREKERLLSLEEPLQFIFSHSTLREGWDNPNVFQICTLNQTTSEIKKRQEIGRGLRLPVDSQGIRIEDDRINRLTVIANESYDSFAQALQTKIEEDSGKSFENRIRNKYEKRAIYFHKQVFLSEDFRILWEKICQKTRYSISFNQEEFIKKASQALKELTVSEPKLSLKKIEFLREKNMRAMATEEKTLGIIKIKAIPDLIKELQKHVCLTRGLLVKILKDSQCLSAAARNPELFIRASVTILKNTMHGIIADGVQYEKIPNHIYELDCIQWAGVTETLQYLSKLYKVQKEEKSLYSHIPCDSKYELDYAEKLDITEEIKLFVKLPYWFKIDTPVGSYNPDWAIVKNGNKKLYFIKETKGVSDPTDLRIKEKQKIKYGKKHFDTLGIEYCAVSYPL